jgi:AraC-like DNA-binding protein
VPVRSEVDCLERGPNGAFERVMWITPDRVFYAGLLGEPSILSKGGILVYVSYGAPIWLQVVGRPWESAQMAVVQPFVRHRVACDAREIGVLMIEPESVDRSQLPDWLAQDSACFEAPERVRHFRWCHDAIAAGSAASGLDPACFDEMFFGQALAPRRMDARIERAVVQIRENLADTRTAACHASEIGLSMPRFLHLFTREVGAPFRTYRAWRRARSLLSHVNRETNLAHLAVAIGYADSTHFSHSIRQIYGLKPKDIFAGSRRLAVVGDVAGRQPSWSGAQARC